MSSVKGTLYLIPTPISETVSGDIFSSSIINLLNELNEFIVEDERSARRFLKKAGYTNSLDAIVFHLLNEHTDTREIPGFIISLLNGKSIGLLSEAGNPCIADPGAQVVAIAQENDIKVKPLVGPSSILLALISSGFNGQQFVFHGYLPIEKNLRIKKIKEIEGDAIHKGQTQIFMETPYRNFALLEDILKSCKPSTMLCIACDITGDQEYIKTRSIADWKIKKADIHKKPAIFLLSA